MSTDTFSAIRKLSNEDLIAKVHLLAQREREATAALIAHLVVLDDRNLHLAAGCSSLFTYCTRILHLSGHAAYGRVEVAHAARRYPVILEMLAEGTVNLTTVALLIPELTPANHRQLLESAKYKTKRQVQELIAMLRPLPPVPSMVRRLPTPVHTLDQIAPPSAPATSEGEALTLSGSVRPAARPVVVPLAPERYKVQFTASAEGYENLQVAQDLLRHQIPNGDVGKVIELALARLVKDLKKEKLGATDRPRVSWGTSPDSRHIPASVKRKVWARDGGRCAFVAQSGRRCDERGFLQFHHVEPHGVGGKATVDNIELRCRAHNGYESELYFGTVQTESEFRKMRKLGL